MEQLIERLNRALAGRYTIYRLLGQGGMAEVFLAQDERLQRAVAIKVLRPEVAAMLGAERFEREIRIAAALNHPNILPVFDSGAADGLLYYVMPHVAGNSLAARIAREKQLPVATAIDIARQVAQALHHAHENGVIHRDIKPENILLDDGRPLVADFGIARALDSAGEEALTRTGIVVGTPAYMSPEQAAGDDHIDGRADVYSLGCVLYEMLAGQEPFTGPSTQAVLARHAMDDVPSLRTVRRTVSQRVEQVILTAMAKVPADRPTSAAALARLLEESAQGERRSGDHRRPREHRLNRVLAAVGAVALIAAGIVAVMKLATPGAGSLALDRNMIAVLPFRTVGAGSQQLEDLADGLVELMYYRLPGSPGPTVVDPRIIGTALNGRRGNLTEADAIEVARDLGAGSVLLGQMLEIGTDRIRLTASLRTVPGGRVVARAEDIEGPTDSLVALVDRLTATLLVREAGEDGQRFNALLGTDLPALREYLAGRTAYAGGRYREAVDRFDRALRIDSTFALAAMGLALAGDFLTGGDDDRGVALAWGSRNRLDHRDSLLLVALAGPRYPAHYTGAEQLRGWEDAVAALPGRRATWQGLGEVLFHVAPAMDVPRAHERSAAAFTRALAIDSLFAPALGHLLELKAAEGDTAAVRRLGNRYLAIDSAGSLADFYRWRVARALDDEPALQAFRDQVDRVDPATLWRIIGMGQLDGTGMADVVWAADNLLARSGRNRDLHISFNALRAVALNRGRPAEAARIATEAGGSAQPGPYLTLGLVVEALYSGGDTALAARALDHNLALADEPPGSNPTNPAFFTVCARGLWNAARGNWSSIPTDLARLRSVPAAADRYNTGYITVCAAILQARWAAALDRAEAGDRLATLDSLVQKRPPANSWIMAAANLTVSRLREQAGDLPGALAAVRRFPYEYDLVPVALATFLREEGRLARATGDRAGAVRAYTHYLALRDDPEPAVRAEVQRVREDLARLVGEDGAAGK